MLMTELVVVVVVVAGAVLASVLCWSVYAAALAWDDGKRGEGCRPHE